MAEHRILVTGGSGDVGGRVVNPLPPLHELAFRGMPEGIADADETTGGGVPAR